MLQNVKLRTTAAIQQFHETPVTHAGGATAYPPPGIGRSFKTDDATHGDWPNLLPHANVTHDARAYADAPAQLRTDAALSQTAMPFPKAPPKICLCQATTFSDL